MGWNKLYEMMERSVVSGYNAGILDKAQLHLLMTPYIGADIEHAGCKGLRSNDGLSADEIVCKVMEPERFCEMALMQALIAIKCLDEGVNIPKIKLAFILASTTNPKEYIQRRGRVLRLAKDKDFAIIYDFITLPRPLDHVRSLTEAQMGRDLSLVKNELCRAQEFARISMNAAEAESIIDEIKDTYGIEESIIGYKEDFGYEQ